VLLKVQVKERSGKMGNGNGNDMYYLFNTSKCYIVKQHYLNKNNITPLDEFFILFLGFKGGT